jgi:hypothetical protein
LHFAQIFEKLWIILDLLWILDFFLKKIFDFPVFFTFKVFLIYCESGLLRLILQKIPLLLPQSPFLLIYLKLLVLLLTLLILPFVNLKLQIYPFIAISYLLNLFLFLIVPQALHLHLTIILVPILQLLQFSLHLPH